MSNRYITASCVGGYGRFGNNLIQYLFARHYAHLLDCELHIPASWVGWECFELDAKPMTRQGQRVNEMDLDYETTAVDIFGYFQDPIFISQLSRKQCKQWVKPKIQVEGHKACAHIRHGDFTSTGGYTAIPYADFIRSFAANGYDKESVAIYSDNLSLPPNGARRDHSNPYMDWLEIRASKAIWRSASSYSWTAAFLSDAEEIYSPLVLDAKDGEPIDFVPNNDAPLHSLFGSMKTKE
jgi:hypothetical protein